VSVVSFGNANVDIIYYVKSIPGPDEQTEAFNVEIYPGGSAANFAVALAVLGLKVYFVGRVGNDEYGEYLLKAYSKRGVIVDYVKVVKGVTGRVIVFVEIEEGKRAMVALRGVNHTLNPRDLDEVLERAKHVHLSSVKTQISLEVFKQAKDRGLTTSYDPGGLVVKERNIGSVLSYVDVIFLNEKEANILEERGVGPATLLNSSNIVVIKRGREGAIAYTDSKKFSCPGFKVKVVDTTGAGDVFDAGFIYSWIKGAPIPECIRVGNGLAALKITKKGAQSLPCKEEILKFFEKLKIKIP